MNRPPITAAMPRRRTARRRSSASSDAADGRSQPDDEGRRGDLADDALGVPEAEVVDLAGDVAQAVVQAARTLRGPAASGAGLEAAGDRERTRRRGRDLAGLRRPPAR